MNYCLNSLKFPAVLFSSSVAVAQKLRSPVGWTGANTASRAICVATDFQL